MKVYLIRHGESETNEKGLWTGWVDAHLTDQGKKQAQKVGEFLRDYAFDKVYTSDLSRTKQTADIVIPGCVYETSELAREFNVGTLGGTPYSETTAKQWEIISQEGFAAVGGESNEELKSRVLSFMKKLETETCESIAVFTHGGWIRTFCNIVIGVHIPKKSMCCKNCMIGIFEYKDEVWKLHSWINLD